MDPHTPAQPCSFNNDGGRLAIQTGAYHNHGQTIVNPTSADKLKRLPHAVEAPFNAYVRQHEPFCLPSTRTALLQAIYDWTDAQDERCLYCLSGFAGTGKSTITRTVARRLNDQRRLGASFFFSKGSGDVSHAGKFVTSIAVQLASHVPGIRQHLADVIKKFPNISSLSLRDQWRHLVLDFSFAPALTIDATSVVLVVDALDECDNGDDIERIIELLAEARDLDGLRLRILVTSRPEVPIRHGFESFDYVSSTLLQRYVLHRIAPNIVNADIALFLSHNLKTIGKQQYLTAGWPGAKVVATMTERASGLFVWAATACRFIQEGRRFAERRLKTIMKDKDDCPMEPEKHLDSLYLTVLRDSICPEYTAEEKEDHCEMLRLVLGTLTVLHVPLSVQALGELLGVGREGIERIVQDLHAILDLPEDENRALRLHHPSLRDFLLDRNRCTDVNFCVDKAQAHSVVTSKCVELMTRFSQDNQDIHVRIKFSGSPSGLLLSYSLGLWYACLHWCLHLEKSDIELDNDTKGIVLPVEYPVAWLPRAAVQCAGRPKHTLKSFGCIYARLKHVLSKHDA